MKEKADINFADTNVSSSMSVQKVKGKLLDEESDIDDSSNERDSNQKDEKKEQIGQREYFTERFNFACVLRGEVKHLERIKAYIVQEYVNTGHVKLIKPTYDKKEIYIVTADQWEEYQKLKKKDPELIGAGWP